MPPQEQRIPLCSPRVIRLCLLFWVGALVAAVLLLWLIQGGRSLVEVVRGARDVIFVLVQGEVGGEQRLLRAEDLVIGV